MTRYEHGFLSKCAEYGIDQQSGRKLMEKKGNIWSIFRNFKNMMQLRQLLKNPGVSQGLSRKALNSEIALLEKALARKGVNLGALGFRSGYGSSAARGFSDGFGVVGVPKSLRGTGSGAVPMFIPNKPNTATGKAIGLLQNRYADRRWRDAISHIYMPDAARKALETGQPSLAGKSLDLQKLMDSLQA